MTVTLQTDTGVHHTPWRSDSMLTEAAALAGIALNTRCAGNGTCKGCEVTLGPGQYRIKGRTVTIQAGETQTALACQTSVQTEDATIYVPSSSLLEREGSIDDAFSLEHFNQRWQAPTPHSEIQLGTMGLAVDIGTTTVAVMLVDLTTGEVLAKASMYNQQIRKADDVTSRISYCHTAANMQELQRMVAQETIDPLISLCCSEAKRSPTDLMRVVVSGNTVMTHLFFNLSPASIGTLPFTPLTRTYPVVQASDLGLMAAPSAMVEAVPSIAGYVGGDVVSDIYLTGLHESGVCSLMIDVGTNGEIVLRNNACIVACATAAGPTFEGYGLTHGCRAATGAIERIDFDETLDMQVRVIGNTKPTGLCGSAIIDFIANGLRCGIINAMGRYDIDRLKAAGRYLSDHTLCGNSQACVIVPAEDTGIHEPLFVTEQDIAQVLKAKAAIYAGLTTLLETQDVKLCDVQRVYLAGGFGRHISLPNAVTLGLFPDIPLERYEVIGNGSLAGAYLALLDPKVMPSLENIIDRPEVIELNQISSFESHFIDALALPHCDETLFPNFQATKTHA